MDIRIGNLRHPAVVALLADHLQGMRDNSPPESVHALDLAALEGPGITFWSAWSGDALMGCAALKRLDDHHGHRQGEIKSMRTAAAWLRRGVAAALLEHVIDEARRLRFCRLSLETGASQAFAPARRLYMRFGFTTCDPFADYRADPLSVFMTRTV